MLSKVEPQKELSEEVKKAEEIEVDKIKSGAAINVFNGDNQYPAKVIKPNSVAGDNIETVENYTPVYIRCPLLQSSSS